MSRFDMMTLPPEMTDGVRTPTIFPQMSHRSQIARPATGQVPAPGLLGILHPNPEGTVMAESANPMKKPREKQPESERADDPPVGQDAAVERGERIEDGKTIARGGKTDGHVPGATQPDK
jgi:hypothetical protein